MEKKTKEKPEVIVMKVPKQMKEQLQLLANADKRKLSDYIRLKLEIIIEKETNPFG